MATDVLFLSDLAVNDGVTWGNPSNAIGNFDDNYADSSDMTVDNCYGGGNFDDVLGTPTSVTLCRLKIFDINSEHSNDNFFIEIWDDLDGQWENLKTYSSGDKLPTTITTVTLTAELQAKFNAASNKTDFLNNLQFRVRLDSVNGTDSVNIGIGGMHVTYEYIGALTLDKNESVDVTDVVTLGITPKLLNVYEEVTVSERFFRPFELVGSRIAAAEYISGEDRDWQAAVNTNVPGWSKSDALIFAIAFLQNETHDEGDQQDMELWYRNKTDESAWAIVSTLPLMEMHTAYTDLGSGDLTVDADETGCDAAIPPTGYDLEPGFELDYAFQDYIQTITGKWSEYHFGISPGDAVHEGDEYEFKIFNNTNDFDFGICLATLTIAIAGLKTLNKYDELGVTEFVNLLIPVLYLSVFEDATVDENIELTIPVLCLNVFETVSTADYQSMSIPGFICLLDVHEDIRVQPWRWGDSVDDPLAAWGWSNNAIDGSWSSHAYTIYEDKPLEIYFNTPQHADEMHLEVQASAGASLTNVTIEIYSGTDWILIHDGAPGALYPSTWTEPFAQQIVYGVRIGFRWTGSGAGWFHGVEINYIPSLLINPFFLDFSEDITASDFVERAKAYSINLFEEIALTEDFTVFGILRLDVYEEIQMLRDITQRTIPQLYFSVFETITLTDGLNWIVEPYEDVTVTDDVTIRIPHFTPEPSENVTVVDVAELVIPQLKLNVGETVTVEDWIGLSVYPLHLNLAEVITVTEQFVRLLPEYYQDLTESVVAVSEFVAMVIAVTPLDKSETVSVTDYASMSIPIQLEVFETVAVTFVQTDTFFNILNINVYELIDIFGEGIVQLKVFNLQVSVFETIKMLPEYEEVWAGVVLWQSLRDLYTPIEYEPINHDSLLSPAQIALNEGPRDVVY